MGHRGPCIWGPWRVPIAPVLGAMGPHAAPSSGFQPGSMRAVLALQVRVLALPGAQALLGLVVGGDLGVQQLLG